MWYTSSDLETLVHLWPGALDISSEALDVYLEAARDQCIAFLGSGSTSFNQPDEIPTRWSLAQVMQAKALSQSPLVGHDDQYGGIGESVTIFPMDWKVKALLRPAQGVSIA